MSDILDSKDSLLRDQVDTPSNRNILDMNADCTRHLFDRFTLNQLIRLRAVCHAWNDIITDICSHKHSLRLFFSGDSVRCYLGETSDLNIQDHPQFQIGAQNLLLISDTTQCHNLRSGLKRNRDGSFSEHRNEPNLGIRFVVRLFPNITNFVCDIKYGRMLELNYILWKWSLTLDTLTIFCETFSNVRIESKKAQQDFVQCFEQLNSLRRLHLFGIVKKLDLPNVRTFGQLEEFGFVKCFQIKFAPYFAQLDANRCTFLRVDDWDPTLNPTDLNAELTSKLTHLAINFSNHPNLATCFTLHIAKFVNLNQLEIIHTHGLMAKLLQKIVPLKKLETLVLKLYSFVDFSEMAEYERNPNYRNTFPVFHNTISQLCLIDGHLNSHLPKFHEYQLLAKIFPMLSVIKIYCTNLNKATFDAQYRARFCEAFGQQVEVIYQLVIKQTLPTLFGKV